ncbi:MAG: hypothetical protein ACO3DQ_04250 [Cephaloticoccus sp.]
MRTLRADDLNGTLFKSYHWVFYLPPKKAFDQALDQVVADALEEDDAGFFAKIAVKGVMLAVKPKICRAIEALRKGLLFQAIVASRTSLPVADVNSLTDTYIKALTADVQDPDHRLPESERAVRAVSTAVAQLEHSAAL